ncbi:hypothetical protein MBLNU230_g6762t1 [Neophaeotheca triangularis]
MADTSQQTTWMSFWDRYLAPGDLRARQQHSASSPEQPRDETTLPPPTPPAQRIDAAHRFRRQNALLYGGLAFTMLSLIITRRSTRRRQLATYPRTFTTSSHISQSPNSPAGGKSEPAIEAIQALGLATLLVSSTAMLGIGAAATYFDVADLEDLRQGVRSSLGYDVYGGDEGSADREIEGWIAEVLAKKDGKPGLSDLKEGIAERVAKMEKDGEEGRIDGK